MKPKSIDIITYGLMQAKRVNYKRGYSTIMKRMIRNNPIDNSLFNKEIEQAYRNKWSPISRNAPLDSFKVYSTIHNKIDLNYVSDYLYAFLIKSILTDERYNAYYSDKNSYETRLLNYYHLFPKVLFRKINGVFYDVEYNYITNIELFVKKINNEKIVIKESTCTAGGKGVLFFSKENTQNLYVTNNNYTIKQLFKKQNNFIVQEKLNQSQDMAQLNKTSINTVRVVTYRSVVDNKVKVLQSLVRKGDNNSFVDNWHSGGSIISINKIGKISNYGYNYNFEKVYHNVIDFIIPKLDVMYELAKEIAEKEFYHRTLSFDFCLDNENNVKIIEINYGVSSWFQITCGSLFGEYTDEVIDYCKHSSGYLSFNSPFSLNRYR